MEEQKKERSLMKEGEFKEFVTTNMYNEDGTLKLHLQTYEGVRRFKSIRRAIKKGYVTLEGYIIPKRPFGNTKSANNILKRKIYEQLKSRRKSI